MVNNVNFRNETPFVIIMIKHTFKVHVWLYSLSVFLAFRLEYNAGNTYNYLQKKKQKPQIRTTGEHLCRRTTYEKPRLWFFLTHIPRENLQRQIYAKWCKKCVQHYHVKLLYIFHWVTSIEIWIKKITYYIE